MSTHISIELTAVPPYCVAGRNDMSSEPLWFLEIWPNKDCGSDAIAFMGDSLEDLDSLWQAMRDAIAARRRANTGSTS